MEDAQFAQLENNAVNASICWIKNDTGYFTMERTVNEYLDAIGANTAPVNDPELIAGRRALAVQRLTIKSIHALDSSELQHLDVRLKEIALDLPTNRNQSIHR